LGFETPSQTECFPESDLICGKHRFPDCGFELLEPRNGVPGGVGHQKGFGIRVVVFSDHVQDRIPPQRADLGRRHNPMATDPAHSYATTVEELLEAARYVIRVGRRDGDPPDTESRQGVDELERRRGCRYPERVLEDGCLLLCPLSAQDKARAGRRPHHGAHLAVGHPAGSLQQPWDAAHVAQGVYTVGVLPNRGVHHLGPHRRSDYFRETGIVVLGCMAWIKEPDPDRLCVRFRYA
jgi:hypothetical protein